MAKASSKGSSNKARQLEPFDKRSINLAKFKPDLTAKDFKALFPPVGGIITFPFFPPSRRLPAPKPSASAGQT